MTRTVLPAATVLTLLLAPAIVAHAGGDERMRWRDAAAIYARCGGRPLLLIEDIRLSRLMAGPTAAAIDATGRREPSAPSLACDDPRAIRDRDWFENDILPLLQQPVLFNDVAKAQ